jgi:dynein heavy chain
LKYLIAEANYGGRVTDDRDRRLLNVYVDQFFNERAITEKNFKLSSIDRYKIPDQSDTSFVLSYLRSLPSSSDHPEAFGQHPNADISSQMHDTNTLLSSVLSLQPRTVDSGGKRREQTTLEIVVVAIRHSISYFVL